jgi:3-oxoacyl-[acyl-carrier-protein] synthase II
MGDREHESVITGLGIVSPLGIGRESFWKALLSGVSGIAPLENARMGTYPVRYGGEVRGFDPKEFIAPRKAIKVMSREIQLAYAAADLAVKDASLDMANVDAERCGVVFGSQMFYGPPDDLKGIYQSILKQGEFGLRGWGAKFPQEMFPLWMLAYLPNMPACHIAIAQQTLGPNNTIVQGNASSMLALLEADSLIQRGWTDVVLVGGTGSRLNLTRQIYSTASHLSQSCDPATACRPYDANRNGTVLAEGSAVIVLERRSHAEKRGASILAAIQGGSRTFGNPIPSQGGVDSDTIERCIRLALANAKRQPGEMRFMIPHGSAIPDLDQLEAQAIQRTLGNVPVSAPKSFFGDAGPGSGILEIAVGALSVANHRVPATLNFTTPDPACPVHVIRGESLCLADPVGMVLAQSTTGQTAAVILGR